MSSARGGAEFGGRAGLQSHGKGWRRGVCVFKLFQSLVSLLNISASSLGRCGPHSCGPWVVPGWLSSTPKLLEGGLWKLLPVTLKGFSDETASPPWRMWCGVEYLYFSPAATPVDSLHPGRPCPPGRWLRISAPLGGAVPQGPLGHLQESSEGKITNPLAPSSRVTWLLPLAPVFFIPSRINRDWDSIRVILVACKAQ